jgi:hypothetical protein
MAESAGIARLPAACSFNIFARYWFKPSCVQRNQNRPTPDEIVPVPIAAKAR